MTAPPSPVVTILRGWNERQAGDAERAARRAAVARAERAGGVLDERDLLRHRGLQRLPLDRAAEEVHRHDRPRPRRDRRRDRCDGRG